MKKITKKGKNRKTAVPVLQVWTEEADALRTHMKPADLEDEEDAIIPVWQLGVKVVQQVDTVDFPALQKEPLKRQSLQELKADGVGPSQVQVQVQIPESECQIEQPTLEIEKEQPRETDEHPAQQTEVIRLQAELSRMCMALQNQSQLWGYDRAILLGENATLRDALYHANLALEIQKRQCTEDQSSLPAEVITLPDCQTQVSNQQETAEVAVPEIVKEEPSVTYEHPAQQTEVTRLQAELSRVSIALHNQSLLWGYDRAVLLKENSRLRDALYHANMAVEMMKRQCTEDRPSLQVEVTTNKDHQREEKDSSLLAETLKENATMKAALSQAKEELQNKSREWEEERTFLLLVNDETIKLQAALCQAQEDLKKQKQQWEKDTSTLLSEKETNKLQAALYQAQEELREQQQQWKQDKSRLLKEQKETTSKLEADLRQAQIKTQCSLDSEERTKLLFRDMAQKAKLNQEQWEEDRSRLLAEREVETIMMQQAKMDLHTLKCEWEKERAQLLAEQKEALEIKTALNKAQEELKEQKLQWEQEKASFRETLNVINKSLEEEEQDRTKTENTLMDRLRNLETQVEEARKPPKKSFKKKFLKFFRRDAGTPSPTSDTLSKDPSTPHS
ncbi:trichohyalin-like [Notolabrus celidotus]|uniref:trichohyalin-like n=1 Tax=Notolabrus celidotus TaxID=1203425 RepID=UPI00148F5579|nr:trichohyalin-like [Notolabrus celidotus]